jgi:hypothetical protein
MNPQEDMRRISEGIECYIQIIKKLGFQNFILEFVSHV